MSDNETIRQAEELANALCILTAVCARLWPDEPLQVRCDPPDVWSVGKPPYDRGAIVGHGDPQAVHEAVSRRMAAMGLPGDYLRGSAH